jgi:hypothetical protein
VENKFYVDEIYEYTVIAPVKTGATILWFLIDRVIHRHAPGQRGGLGGLRGRAGAAAHPHRVDQHRGVVSFLLGALGLLAFIAYQHKDTWLKAFPF